MKANRKRFSVLGALCFTAGVLLSLPSAHAGAIDKLHQFLNSTKTLQGDFAQIVVTKNGVKPQEASGVMMIAKPGKFRWQIEKPYRQLLVGDGEKVWIYDPELRQVTVKKMGAALGSTPAALLVNTGALEKNFVLQEMGMRDGLEWLEAKPKSSDGGFDKVQLGFSGSELKAMQLFDNFGQTTLISLLQVKRNVAIPQGQFHFSAPAGVDVISE